MEYDPEKGVVTYRTRRGTVETLLALEWLARVASHIPNKRAQLLRYLGAYSNKARGLSAKKAHESFDVPPHASLTEPPPPRAVRKSWAKLLAAVWSADPWSAQDVRDP